MPSEGRADHARRCQAGHFLRVSLPSRQPLPVPGERADSQRRNHLGKIGPGKPCLPAPRAFVRHWAVVVQSLSHVLLFATSSTVAHQAPPPSSVSGSLLKFTSIESVMLSNHFILCCPLLLLPLIFPSIRVFSSESALHISCWEEVCLFRVACRSLCPNCSSHALRPFIPGGPFRFAAPLA